MFKDPSPMIAIKRTSWIWYESKIQIYASRMGFLSVKIYILLLLYEAYKNGIDLYFVLSYGANIVAYIFYSIISYTYITQNKMVCNIEKFMMVNFRHFSSRGETIKRNIIRKMKRGTYMAYMQITLCIISLISCLPINSDRSEILYIIMLIKRANVSHEIEIVHFVHFLVVHYGCFQVTYCYSNVMLYHVLHLHFQFMLLIEDCRRLESDLDLSRYSDEGLNRYHSIIERRLASILSYYQIVDKYQVFIADLFRRPMFFVVWFGLIALMFTSYLLVKVDLGPDVVLVFIVWVSIIEIALHFVIYGRIYGDQRDELWNVLMDCQWFNWNTRNKKTYQMFLNHVTKERVIKPGGLIVLDSTFLIWFGRKTVSAVAFLSTIEEINSPK